MVLKEKLKNLTALSIGVALKITDVFLTRRNKVLVWRYGQAVGDQLMMSAAVRQLELQHGKKSYILCSYPELFAHNPRVMKALNFNSIPEFWRANLVRALGGGRYKSIFEFAAQLEPGKNFAQSMRENPDYAQLHLAALYTAHWSLALDLSAPQTEMFFAPGEAEKAIQNYGLSSGKFSVLHSQGKKSYTPNKDWGAENFQKIVELTDKNIQWAQIGAKTDVPLENVIDLRGRTNLRALAAVIKQAELVVCTEGLYTHMAAAVGTPCITVYSGFLSSANSAYVTTVALQKEDVACKPCWLETPCPYGLFCIKSIDPVFVSEKIRQIHKG